MANLYLNETLSASELAAGQLVSIRGDEGRHAVRVSRLRAGERTLVGNGAGLLAECEVESIDRDSFTARVLTATQVDRPQHRFVLAQALAKGDRDDRAVEQSTEFGVDAIIPWQAARSVSRWDTAEKQAKGLAKWQRNAREASKQSLRSWTPEVLPVADLSRLLALTDSAEVLVLHPRGATQLSEWRPPADERDTVLVVGPEGGFTDSELDAFEAAGARVVVLGETVLRTSSAGPAALAVVNTLLGRW